MFWRRKPPPERKYGLEGRSIFPHFDIDIPMPADVPVPPRRILVPAESEAGAEPPARQSPAPVKGR